MNIRWQCRRGMLELDIIFERFLNRGYDQLSPAQKNTFAQLLKQEDPILYDWLVSDISCTDVTLQEIVNIIKQRMK